MSSEKIRAGVWIVGGRGFIATTTILGKFLLQNSKIEPMGMLTYSEHLQHLPLIDWQQIQFGGCDIHSHSLTETLESMVEDNIIPSKITSESAKYLKDVDPNIENIFQLLPPGINLPNSEQIQVVRDCLSRFKKQQNLERVIVVDLSSTQPVADVEDKLFSCKSWESLHEFLKSSSEPVPWSIIYSTAALLENCAYINFTPNIGTELPGLQDLAQQRQLPHAGKDGKTGETLLKTVLAPMFLYRQMKVLAWQSYNMLGNSDGATLANPNSKKAKIRSKDSSLRKILTNSPDLHSHIAIDYVPSLGDWKTAMNFVQFEGFLNVQMSLQFTWSGCDTILAVPLVLDLIRLVELAWRNGEYGTLDYLSAYFKSPIDYPEADFREQIRTLLAHFSSFSKE
jgi:myo-inositol-1-phosphate synthase